MKKISVITISFNAAETIEETILSVISQDYDNLEYLIIDGGSTDGTIDIVNKYKDKISYFVSEPDKGISDAFNKGIKASNGEIIGIINADDFLYKDALKNVGQYFENNHNADIVTGNMITFDTGEVTGRLKNPVTDFDRFKYDFPIFHPSTFIKKSAYEKYGFYSLDYKIAMDYELISKMYFSGAEIGYLNEILSCFRYGGVSGNTGSTMTEHKKIALRNGTSESQFRWFVITKRYIPDLRNNILRKIGLYYMVRNKFKPAEELPVKWWEE